MRADGWGSHPGSNGLAQQDPLGLNRSVWARPIAARPTRGRHRLQPTPRGLLRWWLRGYSPPQHLPADHAATSGWVIRNILAADAEYSGPDG